MRWDSADGRRKPSLGNYPTMTALTRRMFDAPLLWRHVLLQDPCVYCGQGSESLDHIRPLAAGGNNGWTNRAPACHACNGAKGCASLLVFLYEKHFSTEIRVRLIRRHVAQWKRRRDRPELPPPPPMMYSLGDRFPPELLRELAA